MDTSLLDKVRNTWPGAADVLKHAGFQSNTDLRCLSREDLHELFPGVENLQMRKNIFETIPKPGAEEKLLKELTERMQGGLESAINSPGTECWAEYMGFVQKVKKQVDVVEECLRYEINVKESHKPLKPEATKELRRTVSKGLDNFIAQAKTWGVSLPNVLKPNDSNMSTTNDSSAGKIHITVKYKMVVSGETFGAHKQLLKHVEGRDEDRVCFVESRDESQITIVFCPICSRIESDVDSAMADVTDDKPVILVLMFHTTEAQSAMCRLRPVERPNIVLQVAVFYHQTQNGLLMCQENRDALTRVRSEFLKHGEHEPFVDLTEDAVNLPNEAAEVKL